MGFGYGGSQARSGIRRYDNSQVAHVWNAQTESSGQSNNGNFYFRERELYSYGSHYLAGFIMPDGVALLNGRSYSVSTSGHMSDARHAVSNRSTFTVSDLTDLRDLLAAIARGKLDARWKSRARELIRSHAEALAASRRFDPGESHYYLADEEDERGSRVRATDKSTAESAGEYLTRAAGLPAASWPKLAREAAKAKAKREAEQKKSTRERELSRARTLADMPEGEWRRRALAILNPEDNRHAGVYIGSAEQRLGRLALELLRALKLANAEGFSKRRRDTLKRRRREVAERKAEATRIESILHARNNLRSDIALVRAVADKWRGLDDMPADYWQIRQLSDVAEALARLADSEALPFISRRRCRLQAERLAELAPRLQDEHGRLAEERRAREAELRAMKEEELRRLWLAGKAPLARYFDAESGGAALRIKGDLLETSHGASVPLAEAVRAFRFIKLCREAGREWKANGQRIRVGSFHVDWIDSAGNMKAGCHNFTWPEIARAAVAAGVINAPADDSAVILKGVA